MTPALLVGKPPFLSWPPGSACAMAQVAHASLLVLSPPLVHLTCWDTLMILFCMIQYKVLLSKGRYPAISSNDEGFANRIDDDI